MPNGALVIAKSHKIHRLQEPSLRGLGGTFQTVLHQDARTQPLFEGAGPSIADIKQQSIGDCWYLATIIAILSRPLGDAWLLHALVDNLDGTATVRLFDRAGAAHYIQVTKSLAVGLQSRIYGSRLYHSDGALWVAMLEKALTAFDRDGNFDPANAGYQRTEGNDPAIAFMILMNRPKTLLLEETIADPKQRDSKSFHLTLDPKDGWAPSAQKQWEALIQRHRKNDKVLRYETFRQFLALQDKSSVTTKELERVDAFAKDELPGKRFTARYPLSHLGLFNTVDFASMKNMPIVAYSRTTVGRKQVFMGISAGEPMSKGLAGNHAYAVIGAVPDVTAKYIVMMNPWGQTGRTYDKGKPVETESGVFRLELDDAVKRFRGFYATPALTRDELEDQRAADSGIPRPKKEAPKKEAPKKVEVAVVPYRPTHGSSEMVTHIEHPLQGRIDEIRFTLAEQLHLRSPLLEYDQMLKAARHWSRTNHPDKFQTDTDEARTRQEDAFKRVWGLLDAWKALREGGEPKDDEVRAITFI